MIGFVDANSMNYHMYTFQLIITNFRSDNIPGTAIFKLILWTLVFVNFTNVVSLFFSLSRSLARQ